MSGMTTYFIRRLLLVPITFLCITLMVYSILRIVPGGPIEQAETKLKMQAASGEGGGGGGLGDEADLQLDEGALKELERYYALDRPILVGYGQWLGVVPREKYRRVPVVPEKGHEEAWKRLEEARDAIEGAQEELAGVLGEHEVVERRGAIWRKVSNEADVPADVRERALLLDITTFGEQYPLRAFLDPKALMLEGGEFYRRVDVGAETWGADAQPLLEALQAARAVERQAEEETAYYLGADGKPMQAAFRAPLALNDARNQANERLDGLLGPEGLLVFRAKVYRPLTDEERDAPKRQGLFEKAEQIVQGGYGKRDELYEFLDKEGLTWKKGTYYVLLGDEETAEKADYFGRIEALVDARHLANSELGRIKAEKGFEVTEEGRIYSVSSGLHGVLELDFGQSYTYSEPVLSLIGSKMEVSIQFGLIGYIMSWLVCVPLGVFKAIKHKSTFDTMTSVLVFLGYSIPGFVLCLILISTIAVNVDWLPLGGYKPDNIDQMGWWDSFTGRIQHMLIPVAGYMVGAFAGMTILMKNSLLENLGQDYVRTAFAKGLREKRVIFVHALRNSLIPITAGIGHALGLLFAGSFLIEKTCNIDGMGLLGFHAVVGRDYPIILGLLVLLVLIRLTGNIMSDIIWAIIDPRIRFGK